MNDDILNTAVKLARIIDDNAERDNALSWIAQIQAAVNLPEDSLKTIERIRYVDIRADALRKALDNLQTRFYSNKESLTQMDSWLEKLMEETMAIPEIDVRCPKLNAINLLILSRLDDKEKVQTLLKQSRNEFARLKIGRKRSKFLFAVYQMFQQIGNEAEALATLDIILEGISEYKPLDQQGLMIGLVVYEFWKIQGRDLALKYIECIEDPTVQSYAYLQLAELLSVSGNFKDAQQIADCLDDEEHKSSCEHFIDMGKTLIRNASEMKGAVICINKSMYFNNKSNDKTSDKSFGEKPHSFSRPVWLCLTVSIMPKDKNDTDNPESDLIKDDEQSDESGSADQEQTNETQNQETDWDKYDWDGFDWDNIITKNKEIGEKLWNNSYPDDDDDMEDSNDSPEDVWQESDDDETESWKESDDEAEPWEESDEESDDNDAALWNSDINVDNPENESSDNDENNSIPKSLEKKQREFLKKFADNGFPDIIQKIILNRFKHTGNASLDNVPNDKFFCLTESIPGIVSFNRTLPPSLYQHFIRRLTIFFPIIQKDVKERLTPQILEQVEEYISRQEEVGFEEALQEVISQGDYYFAVECALNYFCYRNKDNLIFGYE